jgi:hypothetical protein
MPASAIGLPSTTPGTVGIRQVVSRSPTMPAVHATASSAQIGPGRARPRSTARPPATRR